MAQQNRWLTPSDLESEYGFSKSCQAKMRMNRHTSSIPFSKIGTKFIRYDRVLIDKWIEDQHVNNGLF